MDRVFEILLNDKTFEFCQRNDKAVAHHGKMVFLGVCEPVRVLDGDPYLVVDMAIEHIDDSGRDRDIGSFGETILSEISALYGVFEDLGREILISRKADGPREPERFKVFGIINAVE